MFRFFKEDAMYKYRITIARYPRTEDEIIKNKMSKEFLNLCMVKFGNERSKQFHKEYEKEMEDYVLEDCIYNSKRNDLTAKYFMDDITKKYPEAKLQNWDMY